MSALNRGLSWPSESPRPRKFAGSREAKRNADVRGTSSTCTQFRTALAHAECGASKRAIVSYTRSILDCDLLPAKDKSRLPAAHRRHGIRHQYRMSLPAKPPQHCGVDVRAIDDHSKPRTRRLQRRRHRSGLASGQRAHRIEEVRETGHPFLQREPGLRIGGHGVAKRHVDPGLRPSAQQSQPVPPLAPE
jgi:hypothetical protein